MFLNQNSSPPRILNHVRSKISRCQGEQPEQNAAGDVPQYATGETEIWQIRGIFTMPGCHDGSVSFQLVYKWLN